MKRTLCLLALGCSVLAAQAAGAAEPLQNQTYAALAGASSELSADVDCASGGCFAEQAARDSLGLGLGNLEGLHGSITYRVQSRNHSGSSDLDNLVGFDLSFCQQLCRGMSLQVEIGTGGSFNHPLDAFNSFYHPDSAFEKARLKQAYLHIN